MFGRRRNCQEMTDKPAKKQRTGRHGKEPCKESCAVWLALGAEGKFQKAHSMNNVGHPNEKAEIFNKYLSTRGQKIYLDADSCMCIACYMDAQKHAGNSSYDKGPRWLAIHRPKPVLPQHCPVCHINCEESQQQCPCEDSSGWVPYEVWSMDVGHKMWHVYFESTYGILTKDLKSSHICKRHYMEVYHLHENRKCVLCSEKESNNWEFVQDRQSTVREYMQKTTTCKYPLPTQVHCFDWLCNTCVLNVQRWQTSEKQKRVDTQRDAHGLTVTFISHACDAVHTIEQQRYVLPCLHKSITSAFKHTIRLLQ